jgi:hypothetical protein
MKPGTRFLDRVNLRAGFNNYAWDGRKRYIHSHEHAHSIIQNYQWKRWTVGEWHVIYVKL